MQSQAAPNLLWGRPGDVVSPHALSPEVDTRVVDQEGTVQSRPLRTVEHIDKPGEGTVVSECKMSVEIHLFASLISVNSEYPSELFLLF